MSQETEQEASFGQEIIDQIVLEQEAIAQIAFVLETGTYQEVAQVGKALTDAIATFSEIVDEIGILFIESQEHLVQALLQTKLFQQYEEKISQADLLLHHFPKGSPLSVKIFTGYVPTILAGAETFALSEDEVITVFERWMPHVRIAEQLAKIELYTEYTPIARSIEALLEDQDIPEVIRDMFEIEFEAGKYALRNKILDKKPHFFQQDSLPFEKISARYAAILNDKQLLLLAKTPADTIDAFVSKSVAVLDATDMREKLDSNPYEHRYRRSIAELPWVTGHGKPLRNEVKRLGLTGHDFKLLFTVSLNDIELAISFLDIAASLDELPTKEYALIVRRYIENFLRKDAVVISVGDKPITVKTDQPWPKDYLQLFEFVLEDLGIKKSDPEFLRALERNRKVKTDKN